MSQTALTVVELKTWLEKETGSILTPVQTQAQKERDDTLAALQNLSEASKMLLDNSQKEIEKRNLKVYNRARALNKLAVLFIDRIKKLKVPDQVSFDNLNTFASETQKTMLVTEIDIKNWFPRISPFFIMDRRKFLTVYEKTKLTVNGLNDFVNKEYVKSKLLEKTFMQITELQTLQKQIAELEQIETNLKNEELQLQKEMVNLEQQTAQVKGKAAMDQLNQLETEQETLNNELKLALRHLQKPFLKMQALATSGGGGGITPDELRMLGLYMENPFEAVVSEGSVCPTLKQILEKLARFLEEDKLKLKSDKQRKAEEAVEHILTHDQIANVAKRCTSVAADKRQLMSSPEMEQARRDLGDFQQKMETLRTHKGNLETDETIKKRQRQELLEKARHIKKNIEENVVTFLGKQIQVQ
ncbi:MAG TPA: hypothetical protein VMD05_00825 [Candidatus Nanoarchaeia archaeon]|nr:hypothetical protein [Candidatus Nanoarchaeia archaeon]